MSRFSVSLLPRAQADVQSIFDWLNDQSPQGAIRWNASFEELLILLANSADAFEAAMEANALERPLKQCLFSTRKGGTYRAVYLVEGNRAFILRVRGPGQPNLDGNEI